MLSITSRHSLPNAATTNNARSPFVSVRRAVDDNTAQRRLRKPSLNVAHLRCDSFCTECEHLVDSHPTKPLHDFRALRNSFAAVRDVFAAAPALPSGDELRNCLTAGVQALDAFLALVGDPPSHRAVVAADMMGKVRQRMANANAGWRPSGCAKRCVILCSSLPTTTPICTTCWLMAHWRLARWTMAMRSCFTARRNCFFVTSSSNGLAMQYSFTPIWRRAPAAWRSWRRTRLPTLLPLLSRTRNRMTTM
jgi:hypothetical protein